MVTLTDNEYKALVAGCHEAMLALNYANRDPITALKKVPSDTNIDRGLAALGSAYKLLKAKSKT